MGDGVSKMRGGFRGRLFAWYWARRARRAKNLAAFRREVLARREELDRIATRAETRLARKSERGGTAGWALRPEVFRARQTPSTWVTPAPGARPARGLSVFHDGRAGAFTLAQRPNRGGDERFELFFESYDFDGDYVSLAFAIPDHLRRPKAGEGVRLMLDCATSRPIKTYFRLNLSSTQGQDALNADAIVKDGAVEVGFDMSFAAFEPREGDAIWLDLIFDRPRMIEFSIRSFELRLVQGDGG